MTVITDKIAEIDIVLAKYPEEEVVVPPEIVPDARRVTSLIDSATAMIDREASAKIPPIRRLTRVRELLSRVA